MRKISFLIFLSSFVFANSDLCSKYVNKFSENKNYIINTMYELNDGSQLETNRVLLKLNGAEAIKYCNLAFYAEVVDTLRGTISAIDNKVYEAAQIMRDKSNIYIKECSSNKELSEKKGKWEYIHSIDKFTDEKEEVIQYIDSQHKIVMNKNNFWFKIIRNKSGGISIDKNIIFRVDKNKLREINFKTSISTYNTLKEDNKEIKLDISKKSIGFSTFPYIIPDELFCEMSKGKLLNVRYLTNNSCYEDITISLKGINKVLKKAYKNKGNPNCK